MSKICPQSLQRGGIKNLLNAPFRTGDERAHQVDVRRHEPLAVRGPPQIRRLTSEGVASSRQRTKEDVVAPPRSRFETWGGADLRLIEVAFPKSEVTLSRGRELREHCGKLTPQTGCKPPDRGQVIDVKCRVDTFPIDRLPLHLRMNGEPPGYRNVRPGHRFCFLAIPHDRRVEDPRVRLKPTRENRMDRAGEGLTHSILDPASR